MDEVACGLIDFERRLRKSPRRAPANPSADPRDESSLVPRQDRSRATSDRPVFTLLLDRKSPFRAREGESAPMSLVRP